MQVFGSAATLLVEMHLTPDRRFWESKVKALKPHRSSSKSEVDTRYIADLEATGSFAFKKPKSIRVLKFGRCYIDFGWSPSRAKAAAELDTSNGKEYQEHRSSVELSGSAVELARTELPTHSDNNPVLELSGDRAQEPPVELPTMSAPFEQDAIYELESPMDVDFAHFSTNFGEHQFDLTYPGASKWEVPSAPRMVHRALPRLTTEVSLPSFQGENQIDASPYLSSASSSLTPSPVSPVTPNLDNASNTQRQDWIVSPISARPSSCQSFSHFMQQYAPQFPHPRTSYSEPASSYTSTPIEGSLYTTRMTGSWNMPSGDRSQFSNTRVLPEEESLHYQHMDHELQPPAHPCLDVETSWTGEDFFPSSNDQIDDSVWSSFEIDNARPEQAATENVSTSFSDTQQVADIDHSMRELVRHDGDIVQRNIARGVPRNRTSSSSGRAAQFPREKCHICDKEFTGRYGRGNLSRHIREKHDLIQPLTGKVCRVCDQVYNRADAKRKHEWKKHRLPDAKPNKRRRER